MVKETFNRDYAQYKAFGEAFRKTELSKVVKDSEDSYQALRRLHNKCPEVIKHIHIKILKP